jgi:hypothetical protein
VFGFLAELIFICIIMGFYVIWLSFAEGALLSRVFLCNLLYFYNIIWFVISPKRIFIPVFIMPPFYFWFNS